jgi:ABC-2 type transport system permease protein
MLAGFFITIIGSLIAGVPNPLDPMRMVRMFVVITVTSFALVSLMFFLMARMNDPMLPRAMFGVLNTVLYFPSGAVYPQQGFPPWMQVIAKVDPFTYAVHAFKSLLLKNTGWEAISYDIGYLVVFSAVAMTAATACVQENLVSLWPWPLARKLLRS